MSYHILCESTTWHTRCALFDDTGRLLTLRYDAADRRYIEGAVAYGRVRQVVPSLGAAFVDIGDVQDGLLPLDTLPPELNVKKLTQGKPILVRVARGGFLEKGARLDARTAHKLPAADTPCPSLLQPPPSALTRALHDAGANPVTVWLINAHHRDAVSQHVPERAIRQLDHDIATSEWAATLTDQLDNTLDTMLSERPTFPFTNTRAAGNLIIELTSAVATIDVNAGPLSMGKQDAALGVNLVAAEEVVRLCRLLDLGGSVIVDFITPRSKQHRGIIGQHLAATFQTTDDRFVELRPMSRHGLLELTRERSGPSLTLLLKTPIYVAGRIGLQLWRTPAGANPKLRKQTVKANPQVIAVLQKHLTQNVCLSHLGRPITLESDESCPVARFSISG